MRNIPGRWKIIAAILAVVLLPLAAMTTFTIYTARQSLHRQILQTAVADSQSTAITVARDFDHKLDVLELQASRQLLQEAMRRRDRAETARHLQDLALAVPDFGRAFVTDPAGVLWADHPSIDPAVIGRSFAQRDWYRGVSRTGRPYLSEVFERAARPVRVVYNFAAPVRDARNRLLGYLVIQDDGEHLRKELEKVSLPDGGNIVLVDRNGRLAFEVGTPLAPEEVRDIRPVHRCLNEALRGQECIEFTRHNGRGFAVVAAPINRYGWAVVNHFPTDTLLAPLATLAWQMGAGGALLLLLTAVLAGRWANTFAQNRQLLADTVRLKEERETQRNIYWSQLDAAGDGLALAARDRTLLHVNRAFGRMLGLDSVDALIGRPLAEFRARLLPLLAQPEKYTEAMEKFWSDPQAVGDFELALRDGRVFHFYSVPVQGPGGELIGRSLMCRDMTREREMDRMKSEFVATVSHELRTPLASLLGFSELMLTRKLPEEKNKQFLEVIHKESKRLNTLINDFLDLQRIESGRVSYTLEQLNIASLVREVATLFSNDPQHPLRLGLPESLPPALGDHDRIKQVLQNLLSNAVKFSPKGGEIVVAARTTDDGMIEVTITDHGLGIPEEAMPKLFGKFYRVDSTDRREIGGTGLGLALCREIVQAHRGKIWAESKPGAGSTFRFTLPLKPAAAAGPVTPAPAAAPETQYALVVEDDASFASLVREHLAEAGLSARIEPTAEGALEQARAQPPALIILDIHLAGKMDGWDFLIEVKADRKLADTPVIITTVTEKRARGLALGASDYLVKPFPMEMLVDNVRRYLPTPEDCKVLVVDDDASFRASTMATLKYSLRCKTDEAENGKVALERIKLHIPDLVILDLLMPEMNGFAVLDALRARSETAALPVLVVTGKDLTPQDKEHLKQGMARVLTKAEYSHQKLLALVNELLKKPPKA